MWFLIAVVAGAVIVLKTMKKGKPVLPGYDIKNQSVIVGGEERIRRTAAPLGRVGVENGLLAYVDEKCRTLYEAFKRGQEISPDGPCLGRIETVDQNGVKKLEFVWETYNEIQTRLTNFGSGLISLNVPAGQDTFVGVYSQNRPEWVITEQAVNAYSMVLVPLYDTLGADAVKFIINQAGIKVVVVDPPKVKPLGECLSECKTLNLVVKMGEEVTEAEKAMYAQHNIMLVSFTHVENQGKANPSPHRPPRPADLATICYTSGTTGDPKGAMLTHGNLVADSGAAAHLINISSVSPVQRDDVHISYLPLAHMFERVVQLWIYSSGARVGFFRGDVKLLTDDIKLLRPTIFPSVPRLLNRIYDKITNQVEGAGFIKKTLFSLALASKEAELKQGIVRNDSIWDKIVFSKIQQTLGGRVRFMITGAAPISPKVLNFLRCVLGCVFVEGYGQTECTAGSNITTFGDFEPGCVGPPLPCNEIKLFDVPDMNYFSKDDKGEICFRGPNVMRGYLNNPEKTKEAIDENGWLHSGDIGQWNANGTLKIIDRKKAIFKLAQGEYIAPEKIENVYIRSQPVMQIFVYGNSLEASLVAVVVPDREELPKWIRQKIPSLSGNESIEELCASKQVEKAIFDDLIAVGNAGGLKSFEQVRAIRLTTNEFTVQNNLLTPTFKAKRPQLQIAFQNVIDELYQVVHQNEK